MNALFLVPLLLLTAPEPPRPADAETRSLLGHWLIAPDLDPDLRASHQEKLAAARARLDAAPDEVESAIWLGRRTAYLGRYREAIQIYSNAIARWPDEPRLYRHRGHRYISTRQLDLARTDLSRAAELIEGTEDQVEPDGLPNARNIPTSTLQTNIWYHLGLTHYLQGDFEAALAAYRACLEVSRNPDMQVATIYWLVNSLVRANRADEVAAHLAPITADLDIIENDGYHRLLLLHRGQLTERDVHDPEADGVGNATVAYGVAMWHFAHGRPERYRQILEDVLTGSSWAAFGYLAAEADVARTR